MADFSWYTDMPPEEKKAMDTLKDMDPNQPILSIAFDEETNENYRAKVATVDTDLIYHIFPKAFLPNWEDLIGDAFLEVYKNPDHLMANYEKKVGAWAICVRGYGNNPMVGMIKMKVFDSLNRMLNALIVTDE